MIKSKTNTTKVIISLRQPEREILNREAERRGIPASRLAAELLRGLLLKDSENGGQAKEEKPS